MITAIEKEPLELGDLVYVYWDADAQDFFAVKFVAEEHWGPSGIMMSRVEGDESLVNIKQTGVIYDERTST